MTFFEVANDFTKSETPFVVVTMLSGRGQAPQDPGAKMIVTKDGLAFGTIGGGRVEAKAITVAQDLLLQNKKEPVLHTWNLQKDIGMSCGGEATYLFEAHNLNNWKIALFGAGHVAQALTRTLANLPCQVFCFDTRQEWLDKLPKASNIKSNFSIDLASRVKELSEDCFFLVMTQGHATDVPVLSEIFSNFPRAPYIGVIGSDVKALKIKQELKERGVDPELLNRLRCPVGKPVGSNHPYEISISIASEIIEVRDRRADASKSA